MRLVKDVDLKVSGQKVVRLPLENKQKVGSAI